MELVFDPVHLAADNAEESPVVDEDLDAILYHLLIKCACFLDVFQVVCKSAAAFLLDANFYEFGIRLVKKMSELQDRSWSQGHGRLSRPRSSRTVRFWGRGEGLRHSRSSHGRVKGSGGRVPPGLLPTCRERAPRNNPEASC